MANRTKTIQELNLEDDFLFGKVMSDTEICRKVLEKILNVPIKKVEFLVTQKTIDVLLDGKGIRLDVYVNDEQGTIYSVEMQRGKKRELPKRTRFYQCNIDSDLLSPGDNYTKLNKTYIIFICTFDPFSDGRHIYTFEERCLENLSLTLGDETTRIFLSTRGKMDDVDAEMKEFLAYIENSTDDFAEQASSPLVKEIHKRVTEVKLNKDMEVEYMTLLQRDRENLEQGREEGRVEGREEGTLLATKIIKLHTKGANSKEIAASLDLSLDYVQDTITKFEND